MLQLSESGPEAERQMRAVIFYLTTFGYIDGDFDEKERSFVRDYIARLVRHRVETAVDASDGDLRAELADKYTKHFHEVFDSIDGQVRDLFTEAVANTEDQRDFVHAKLKLRCYEIFQSFDRNSQDQLLDAIDDLISADGQLHPAEVEFRAEMANLFEADLDVELVEEGEPARTRVSVEAPRSLRPPAESHPLLDALEHHYSASPDALGRQVAADRKLLDEMIRVLALQREAGAGQLSGKHKVAELRGSFLDGHTYVIAPEPGRSYELTVLGDLHGCYSCLKAALMQSRFFERVAAYRQDPVNQPNPKLVLLGDYIDRGIYSYQGVFRAVLQLLIRAPEHVVVLRGNHEYYVELKGRVYGGVKPAEAIRTLEPHLPHDVFRHYMTAFESLPNVLLFDRFMFVHGGIPRDGTLKGKYHDLSSLNDPELRFQMMWSDPSSVDVIPQALQAQSARFPFGRLQCKAFLQRIGCHTLIRGHEKVTEGFRRVYDEADQLLITLFSAGGATNEDLPADSAYRGVTPMAMTLRFDGSGNSEIVPWRIDYESYNAPELNAFFRQEPEIVHVVDRT
jgi:hypothetical protein